MERFLTFLDNKGHTGRDLANSVLEYLKGLGIDISNCRGQTYDNAANMSGIYNGMQAAVREVVPHADFVPCFAHSLNLVGQSAVNCCTGATKFFDFVGKIYVFFSASTSRWQRLSGVLKEHQLSVVKRLSDTRWSAHCDATHALLRGYEYIWQLVETISDDKSQNAETRATAKGLATAFSNLETAVMTEVWDCILTRFNATSKSLQDSCVDLNTAFKDLKSLKSFVMSLRERFDEFEERAIVRCNNSEYQSSVKRIQRRNKRLDYDSGLKSNSNEITLSPRDNFKVKTYLPILDQLVSSLDKRVDAYQLLSKRFNFLAHIGSDKCNPKSVSEEARELVSLYPQDIEPLLGDELIHLSEFVSLCKDEKEEGESNEMFTYRIMKDKGLASTFPNAEILLRIYLSLMVSNASGERSFSKSKLIKSELRSVMSQQRLKSLSLLSIESDVLKKLDFEDVIDKFSIKKSRKLSN